MSLTRQNCLLLSQNRASRWSRNPGAGRTVPSPQSHVAGSPPAAASPGGAETGEFEMEAGGLVEISRAAGDTKPDAWDAAETSRLEKSSTSVEDEAGALTTGGSMLEGFHLAAEESTSKAASSGGGGAAGWNSS